MENSLYSTITLISIIISLLIAIIGHEIMHGFAAYKYRDFTAKYQGRLSINPISHVDIIGTIIFPIGLYIIGAPFLFGWAKPVPINSYTVIQNGGNWGMVVVSLAGVMYNFTLALVAALLINSGIDTGIFAYFLMQLVIYNILLGVFNLIPIPPLDGFNAVVYISKTFGLNDIALSFEKIRRYGSFAIFAIFAFSMLLPEYSIVEKIFSPVFALINSIIVGLIG